MDKNHFWLMGLWLGYAIVTHGLAISGALNSKGLFFITHTSIRGPG